MKKMIFAVVPLVLGIILLIASKFAPVTVQENGMIDEPYFFLTPVGALLIFVGVVALIITIISNAKKASQ
ncbi:DUF3955 domain-containing protein [Lysinibacillus sphaericus]|uniref:DUF3955 domain-containing protein n=3 Tax=Lysinibacillus TaxID=400634 RepID=A0A2S0K0F7_LYSSH|nr:MULTISPECIES: DUF3955 domain-containing protein [Lysinibacillus]AHN21970.1 hypothetical protein T479_11635 [Lysinibacillus varians]AVK96821.1 hypothetical protein LS41612_11380 [Lysinibacillus sphaericus]MCS1384518.1 DUF3955 domain-containing protein [Lysinibacillus sphaericus]MED4545712.1 DUF3955 domain-containing protein [Lysinibacillus sphaericus]TKI16724.1 DUF3955 domain-containing protein [Lysinibacillus sphaericus]